jgi:WD40 repeat protein
MRTGTPSTGSGGTHATFSPDGRLIATVTAVRLTESGGGPALGGYRRVAIWDAATGDPIGEVRGHRTFVNWAAFDARGGRLATAGDDRTVRVWGADKQEELRVLRGHEGVVYRAAFLPDGNVVSLASDGIRVWRVAPVTRRVRGTGAGISSDGSHYGLVQRADLVIGDTRSAEPPRRLLPWRDFGAFYREDVQAAVPTDHGDWLGVTAQPDAVRLVNARSGTLAARVKDARAIAFAARGSTAVVASADVRTTAAGGPPRVIATDSGAERATLGRDPRAYGVAMTPDGRTVIAGYENGDAVIWRADGHLVRRLHGHTDRVLDVGFARAQGSAITASRDGTARVWPSGGGDPVVLEGHAGAVMLAALSANGELALTAGEDGTVRVWDAQTGDLVETYLAQAREPGGLAFVGDSASFAVTLDGGVEIIDCEPCRPIERLRADARSRSSARYTAAERGRLVAD